MKTSAEGIAFLERHEGVVLRAYRCPAGVWTIGAGLTAASGVVKPHAGMVITAQTARAMLAEALERNYEPAVRAAMAGSGQVAQHEFDAGVSFHFNTGAIARASWVKAFRILDWALVEKGLKAWNKGGGRVLAGLVRRRAEEFALMRHGDYGPGAPVRPAPATAGEARIAAPVTAADVPAIRAALVAMGHMSADLPGLPAEAVRRFQSERGLTVDGIVGRATQSAILRHQQSLRHVAPAVAVPMVSATATVSDAGEILTGLPWLAPSGLAGGLIYAGWFAWAYRDALAPLFDRSLPRLAALMRSF
jgi:lysozyme